MTARYPIAIEQGTERTAFGIVVPDLPGCFSAGDTLDDAMRDVEEAVAAWIDAALDAGEAIPGPSTLDVIKADATYEGWTFAIVSVDPGLLDDTIERVNITLPRRVLKRLDALARAAGETRSGYIAQLTLEEPSYRKATRQRQGQVAPADPATVRGSRNSLPVFERPKA